jgi:hypothetical protein
MKPKGVSDFFKSILRLSTIVFATGAFTASVHAADYTWGGGNSSWTDTTATGWNGGPPVGGDTATINSGTVTPTVNDQQYGVALTLGSAGALNDGGFYTYFGPTGSLTMNGGTINITRNNGYYFGWYDGSLSPVVNANSGSSFINTTNASGGLRLEGDTTFSGDGNLTIGLGLHNYTDGLGFLARPTSPNPAPARSRSLVRVPTAATPTSTAARWYWKVPGNSIPISAGRIERSR